MGCPHDVLWCQSRRCLQRGMILHAICPRNRTADWSALSSGRIEEGPLLRNEKSKQEGYRKNLFLPFKTTCWLYSTSCQNVRILAEITRLADQAIASEAEGSLQHVRYHHQQHTVHWGLWERKTMWTKGQAIQRLSNDQIEKIKWLYYRTQNIQANNYTDIMINNE